MQQIRLLFFFSLLLFAPLAVSSEEARPLTREEALKRELESSHDLYQAPEKESSGSEDRFTQQFTRMVVILGFMMVALLTAAWFFRKFMGTRIEQMNQTSAIKILEQRSLSPKSALYLVEIHGRRVLIGDAANGLTLLSDISGSRGKEFEKI